ncbi:MAG: hypothetical protein WCP86_11695, partial [bacterium]
MATLRNVGDDSTVERLLARMQESRANAANEPMSKDLIVGCVHTIRRQREIGAYSFSIATV